VLRLELTLVNLPTSYFDFNLRLELERDVVICACDQKTNWKSGREEETAANATIEVSNTMHRLTLSSFCEKYMQHYCIAEKQQITSCRFFSTKLNGNVSTNCC